MCASLLDFFLKKLNASKQSTKHVIGCISPYKKQVTALNEKLRGTHGMKYRDFIAVNTVDAFQVRLST